jgi:multiple sugar transport system substrate-binding protein
MRNWPYAYVPGNDPSVSQVAGKFDIHSMLSGGNNTIGHSCIGGWQLGINAYSKYPDAAWSFIQYMISPYAQKYIALKTSLIAILTSVYDDREVLAKNPFFKSLKPILENAQPRPVSPKYADISSSIQFHIYRALKKQLSPVDALSSLQASLLSIVAS